MQQNMFYNMTQKQLFDWINQISFVLDDTALYLNTHPTDSEAIMYFNHYQTMRKEALKTYSKKYSPLTKDSITDCQDEWKWIYGNWPWEGGIC